MTFVIEPVTGADLPELLALNESSVPHVNSIPLAAMQSFRAMTPHFLVVRDAPRIAGFVIALAPGADYVSPNYRWFSSRYDRFLYIDRIIVHPPFRRRGVASLLYRELRDIAIAGGHERLTCEVNLRPPNPDSLALHEGLGFSRVGVQETDDGDKEVALLAWELAR